MMQICGCSGGIAIVNSDRPSHNSVFLEVQIGNQISSRRDACFQTVGYLPHNSGQSCILTDVSVIEQSLMNKLLIVPHSFLLVFQFHYKSHIRQTDAHILVSRNADFNMLSIYGPRSNKTTASGDRRK